MNQINNKQCVLAWHHIFVGPDGKLKPCCRFRAHSEQPSLPNSPQNLTQSPFESLRKKMLANEWDSGCRRCHEEELAGKHSLRQIHNRLPLFQGWEENSNTKVRYIEFSDSNVCNLACRMCEPKFSTKWNADYEKIMGKPWLKNNNEMPESVWRAIDWNSIELLKFTGGEPFLAAKTKRILDFLVETKKASDIALLFSTNLTVSLGTEWLKTLKNFKRVEICCSIDGLGVANDYVRHHSDWIDIEKNFDEIAQITSRYPAFRLGLRPTVSVYNGPHIPALLSWWQKKIKIHALKENQMFINPTHVTFPEHLALNCIPHEIKLRARQDLKAKSLRFGLDPVLSSYVDYLIQYMMAEDRSDLWPQFLDWTQKLDRIRGQNYQSILHDWLEEPLSATI